MYSFLFDTNLDFFMFGVARIERKIVFYFGPFSLIIEKVK